MYIIDGIAYAGDSTPAIRVVGIRPVAGHRLWLRFNNGEAKVFDFNPLLETPAFKPLNDENVFRDVYIDYGIPVWMDGEIDIDPLYLFEHSILSEPTVSAG